MIILDYVLLAILAYFALSGLRKGLIVAVGSIVGLILSVVLTTRYFELVAEKVAPYVGLSGNLNLAKIIAFIVLLIITNRILALIVGMIHKAYTTAAVIPGMKLTNRLLGAVLGLIEGSIMLGLIIYFSAQFPFGSIVTSFLADSKVAPLMLSIAQIVQPFLPEAMRQIKGLI